MRHPVLLAVAVWLLCTPVAFLVTAEADLYPFHNRAWALSIAAAFLAIGGLLALYRVGGDGRPANWLAGIGAGLLAAWVVLSLRVMLDGTPFGFGGLADDAGRVTAAATRYSVTLASTDAFVAGVPTEAPPLYPWLIGRAAVLLDTPAWRLAGDAAVLGMAVAVLACFALWCRLVSPWPALVIAALGLLVLGDARKPYEVITLLAFVPWVLLTFVRRDALPVRRLHWLPAGVIGGLFALTYQAWLVFGALGVGVLAWQAWRAERGAYLRHLAGVAATAFVVASWHVVPYLWAMLTRDGTFVSDLFTPFGIHLRMFPFLEPTPLGAVQLAGLAGVVLLRGRVWWATPLLLLAAGAFAYRVLAMVPYVPTGHTRFLHYTVNLYGAVLAAAGVLTIGYAVPRLVQRLALPRPPAGTAAVGVALLLAWTTYTYGLLWFPGTSQANSPTTAAAHREPLPQGGYPRFAPELGRLPWFPVYRIRDAVEEVRGPDARLVTLSPDERLYAYLPWPGYLGTSRLASGSFVRWDERSAELRRLAATADPGAFARESAATRFGPIDVFVLVRQPDGRWAWREGVTFSSGQFDPMAWAVFDDLPENYVVAIRRP